MSKISRTSDPPLNALTSICSNMIWGSVQVLYEEWNLLLTFWWWLSLHSGVYSTDDSPIPSLQLVFIPYTTYKADKDFDSPGLSVLYCKSCVRDRLTCRCTNVKNVNHVIEVRMVWLNTVKVNMKAKFFPVNTASFSRYIITLLKHIENP